MSLVMETERDARVAGVTLKLLGLAGKIQGTDTGILPGSLGENFKIDGRKLVFSNIIISEDDIGAMIESYLQIGVPEE